MGKGPACADEGNMDDRLALVSQAMSATCGGLLYWRHIARIAFNMQRV